MLFKDLEFHDKPYVMKLWKNKIISKAMRLFDDENVTIYGSALNRYVEYLLEDTDYNTRMNIFYDPGSRFEFTSNVFAQITFEYVMDHLDEFRILE